MTASFYFVTPAPGHYGDRATVLSSHATLAAARRVAGRGYVVRVGRMAKGQTWLRSSESVYPLA